MAVYAHNVNRVTITGDCFDGAEIWSTGFWMGQEGGDAGDPAGSAQDIAGWWNAHFTTTAAITSNKYRTIQVKVSQHKASDGKVDLSKVDFYDLNPVTTGNSAGSKMPPQITLAATLTSELQRGTGSKGRMYLPGINTVVGDDAKITVTAQNSLVTSLKTMFDNINSDPDIPDRVILVSRGTKVTDAGTGDIHYINPLNRNVTGLRVGDVYDTQRRRRNDLTEVYVTAVLA